SQQRSGPALLYLHIGCAVIEWTHYSSTIGGNVTIRCSLGAAERNRKFLCREDCKKVLIGTIDVVAKSGKYSIEYGTFPVSSTYLYVSITQLTKSDSGRYRCGLERPFLPDSYWEFEIRVTDGEFLCKRIESHVMLPGSHPFST
uniref:Immunoglobulin subtype domain-containing protein n=1 Tax=Seriola dumerili TaxID=41447 RepID=A0A3B4TQK1_SERDU